MTSKDIAEAMAYDRINPFGESRADYRAAIIASTVASAHLGSNLPPSDFMPDFSGEEKPSPQEQKVNSQVKEAFGIGNNS